MTGTSQIISGSMDLMSMPFAAFEAIWTGTPVGTFSVDGSLGTLDSSGNMLWYPTGTSVNNPAGTSDSTLVNLGFPCGFRYIRLSYTNASGVGVLKINGMAKAGGGS